MLHQLVWVVTGQTSSFQPLSRRWGKWHPLRSELPKSNAGNALRVLRCTVVKCLSPNRVRAQIASDLHLHILENGGFDGFRLQVATEAEVLVRAVDIDCGAYAVD